MRRYRVPSEIRWVNHGWKEVLASSEQAAMADFHGRGWTGDRSNLQIMVDGWWHFADCVTKGDA